VEIAFYIAQILVCIALIIVVVMQARTAGMQSRDAGSFFRTRRGLEKTLYQTTIVLAVVFLLLSLLISLPLFGGPAPATVPAGFVGAPWL
jgi:preprotein translocase subunit SecG